MGGLMVDAIGVGLAAPQLGISQRLFVYRLGRDAPLQAVVNPVIEWSGEDQDTFEEGCLSIPGVLVDVERPVHVRVRALDEHGDERLIEASGLEARVIQHELDHLDGVLMLDRTRRDERKRAMRSCARPRRTRGGLAPSPPSCGPSISAPAVRRHSSRAARGEPSLACARGHAPRPPKGARPKLSPPPVAEAARDLGLELDQPGSVNSDEARARIAAAEPEVIAICAFGGLIEEPLLSSWEMLNVHPSLLPRWRGAAPVERAIEAGDEVTGVTIMRPTAELDAGPICLQAEEPLRPDDDYGSLSQRLAHLGAELLVQALDERPAFGEQPDEGVTYAEKIGPQDRVLRIDEPPDALARRVRALSPHVGAYVNLAGGERLGVLRAVAFDGDRAAAPSPGRVAIVEGSVLLGAQGGALELIEVKPAGRRAMDAAAWARGHADAVA